MSGPDNRTSSLIPQKKENHGIYVFNPNSHHVYVLVFVRVWLLYLFFFQLVRWLLTTEVGRWDFPIFVSFLFISNCFLGDVPKRGILNHPCSEFRWSSFFRHKSHRRGSQRGFCGTDSWKLTCFRSTYNSHA